MHYAYKAASNNSQQTSSQASPDWAVCLLVSSAIGLSLIEICTSRATLTLGSCLLFVVLIFFIRFLKIRRNHNEEPTATTSAASLRRRAALGLQRRWRRQQERDAAAAAVVLQHGPGASSMLVVRHQHQQQENNANNRNNDSFKLQQITTKILNNNNDTAAAAAAGSPFDQSRRTVDLEATRPNGTNLTTTCAISEINVPNIHSSIIFNDVEQKKLAILLCSAAWAAAMAIKSAKFIPLQPVIMFIDYTLLSYYNDYKQVFLILLIGNLLHLIIYSANGFIYGHQNNSYDKLLINNNYGANNTAAGNYTFATSTSSSSTQVLKNERVILVNGEQSHQWLLLKHLLIITFTYAIFHIIGLYLNRKNKVNLQKSLEDIKGYVASKIDLDNEDKKLSKLMESVIPKHLAGKMRDDIMCPTNKIRNFYPIYLTSYDNVSILFADIVNFTKISSNCSAQLLVETLNELFGRFDKAADNRQCLRIKILGDCYYCVSGIPNQEPAHARQCVEMGLDMIDTLRELSQGDNQGVDLNMRVGIHTGRVLCGVLGKKRWQFDVHSNDVKLANHTEQSGIPGRVHITEDTLRALDGRYAVEEANGHQRDTYISQRNISTYFVIPPPDRRRSSLSSAKLMGLCSNVSSAVTTQVTVATSQQVIGASDLSGNAQVAKKQLNLCLAQCGQNHHQKPQQQQQHKHPQEVPEEPTEAELANGGVEDRVASSSPLSDNANGRTTIMAATVATSEAADSNKIQLDARGKPKSIGCLATVTSAATASSLSEPSNLAGKAAPEAAGAKGLMMTMVEAEQQRLQPLQAQPLLPKPTSRPPTALAARQRFKQTGKRIINALHFIRTIDAPFANLDCQPSAAIVDKMTQDAINARSQIKDINKLTLQFKDEQMLRLYLDELGWTRYVRGFFLYLCAFVSLIVLIYSQTWSLALPKATATVPGAKLAQPTRTFSPPPNDTYGALNWKHWGHPIETSSDAADGNRSIIRADWYEQRQYLNERLGLNQKLNEPDQRLESSLLMTLFITLYILTTIIYAHQVELSSRRDFIWRRMALNDREQMARVRDCNKLIFFNLLPRHVATYFLNQRNVGHMDLYHRSYTLAGVMFATVTNFSDFYSEIQGNNHGLDCLRVLNEIICDFDLLLERFEAIDKIKTIGSTYMAAIGLFPDHELPLVAPTPIIRDDNKTTAIELQRTATSEEIVARKEIAKYLRIFLDFINEMRLCLKDFNEHSYNTFKLRVGVNLGPVTAGVIGATKPQYDIWGNTVNVASRMESTCEPNNIQVTEDVYLYLKHDRTLDFSCRGEINVKGKGSMTTYYVQVLTNRES